MLLHIAAGIEHALMVQYLYAAYSLGGEQIPTKTQRRMVERWQKSILAIAKEEMGHLLTVQNILTLLGGPINLDREDFPWDVPYYPFEFKLEPLTMKSLSYYLYAEMPEEREFEEAPGKKLPPRFQEFKDEDIAKIKKTVRQVVHGKTRADPHRVGELYGEIVKLIEDTDRIPDSAFQEGTFRLQASWDDWGRGYQPDPRMLDARGNIIEPGPSTQTAKKKPLPPSAREAHVMIAQVATRTQAVQALKAISGQGEAPHLEENDTGEPSHFERFLEIYQEFEKTLKTNKRFIPSRKVPVNPGTRSRKEGGRGDYISNERSRIWAELFDLRYRMLLTYLAHTFRLARDTRADEPGARAVTMHRVFGEMYNLKTIAGILMRLPLRRAAKGQRNGAGDGSRRAGPPFGIPYSLRLPPTEADTWKLHHDLLEASTRICAELLLHPDADEHEDSMRYLRTLGGLDYQTGIWIEKSLAGLKSTERQRV
jgi:hypothetical protein